MSSEPENESGLPLSFGQERLWFLDRLEPDAAVYSIPMVLRLEGPLDVGALGGAMEEVVRRHEILRTRFELEDGQPHQVMGGPGRWEWRVADRSGLGGEAGAAEARRLCDEEARRPFDLARGPVVRVRLYRLGREEHVFFLNVHHIAWDGWSEGVLIRELGRLYEAYCNGLPSPLAELPIQYADFAAWQRDWLQGPILEKQLGYWREQLKGAPALLELPTERSRPAVQSFRGAGEEVIFPEGLLRKLKALSQEEGCSLFMTLLAAWQTLLHRYTGREDIVVGSPIAGRTRTELEGLIGFFVNTLVLRGDLSGNPRFRELLKRAREMTLDGYGHQDLPFEILVKELRPERNLSYNPLCQVMFALQTMPALPARLGGGLSLRVEPVSEAAAQYDLSLFMREQLGGLAATMEYRVDLYEPETIRRVLGNFQTLLEGIIANPGERIGSLPMLEERERRRMVVEWNGTGKEYPRDKCLHELFELQVERTPDAVAVMYENQFLTYRELDARANKLARHLQRLEVGADSLVGLCAERSLEMVVGLLGILKAGGAYVPLDPEYPAQRLTFMVKDAGAKVVLTQGHLVEALPASGVPVIRLDADWAAIEGEDSGRVKSAVTPADLAYMIYTSGSTGQPKGVMNTHQGIVNRLLWMLDTYEMTPADRLVQKTPFSFDVSVWEFFWPLLTGARLVMARPGGHRDAAYLARLVAEEKITKMHFVPSMLQVFLEQEDLSTACGSLTRVFCSGEALTLELTRRFHSTLDAELSNLYGPTEASVEVTRWDCERGSLLHMVPIGRPIANTQIYILDGQFQPVPVAVAGELHIGGIGVARGYHNRPELTAEKFIADPFSADPNARLYRTGDSARYLSDGSIEYLGRLDHQVKIRGLRVELGEIEELLNQHPGVQTSVVVAREDIPGDQRLVAYVVSRNGAVRPPELREFLRVKLPAYMMPVTFVAVDALPLTTSGKVDRMALPRPDYEAAADTSKFVAPCTATEIAVAGICCEVLGLKQIGVQDNFFDMGGHSMLAVQFISKVNKALSLKLRISVLFQNPMIAGLAGVIDQMQPEQRELQPAGRNDWAVPLITFQAKGNLPPLFFLHGDWSGGGVYCGRLSQQLGEEQPFHALPPYRAGPQTVLTVEEMARYHIGVIKEHTPHGPYLLGGYCIGASVAMEVARQLVEMGARVEHLLMIDPPPTHARSASLRRIWPIMNKAGEILRWDLQKKLDHLYAYDRWMAKSAGRKLKTLLRHFLRKSGIASNAKAAGEEENRGHMDPTYKINLMAFHFAQCLYTVKPFCVPTTLYFPEESASARPAWALRAQEGAMKATVATVPGDHDTCVSKHTSTLADKIRRSLDGLPSEGDRAEGPGVS